MKFKKYMKETAEVSLSKKLVLDESLETDPSMFYVKDEVDRMYRPVNNLINDGKYEEAKNQIDALEADLTEYEQENSKKRFFRVPKMFFDSQRAQLDALRAKLPKVESIEDMHKRCPECNTLLNDGGTCPKCDDGEEDYGDELKEELSNKEKLKRAFPELNFDVTETVTEEIQTEELSVREKLKRAYPELNFDTPVVEEVTVDTDSSEETEDNWYDDDYDIDDDVEQDRRHAALYGGDRMYCKCGAKLKMDEWGSYCPECNPDKEIYDDEV